MPGKVWKRWKRAAKRADKPKKPSIKNGNMYPGNCFVCGVYVPAGAGHYQSPALPVRCADCVGKGNEPLTDRAREATARRRKREALSGLEEVPAPSTSIDWDF